MILEFLVLGGGGFFLYKDGQKGFPKTKRFIEKASGGRILLTEKSKQKSLVSKSEDAVQEKAKKLAKLRESVATIEANLKIHLRQAAEQEKLAQDFDDALEKSIHKNDNEAEDCAASGKIEAQRRARMFKSLADGEAKILPPLMRDLDDAELEFNVSQDKASTVKAFVEVAQAKQELYLLGSSISTEAGITAEGELDQALLESEREMYKAESLLGMAQRRNGNGARRLLMSAEVEAEKEAVRKRMALPESTESDPDSRRVIAEVVNE